MERMTKTVGEDAAAIMGAHIEFADKDMDNGAIDGGTCAEC